MSRAEWEADMAIVGYARVSTRDQDLAGQGGVEGRRLRVGLPGESVRCRFRPEGAGPAGSEIERGDTVIVTRLDRLARSTRDLLNILDEIGKAGAGFRSIKDTWADTTTSHGRLMLTILGGLAEFERELIKDRTDAGRVRAKARGVKFGRKPKLNPFQREQALARLSTGETQAEVARTYGVDRATISRLASPLPFEAGAALPGN
jgi:DNA invertase Pin-like site-specific DNA recombinase